MDSMQIIPAGGADSIPVVMTSSAYYLPYLSVTLRSIIDQAAPENHYDILILHKEVGMDMQRRVLGMAAGRPNITIRFVEMARELAELDYNFREGYSPESFYRVVMAFIFPQYEKMLYLDCDTVVMQDVADLYHTDIRGFLCAAAKDPNGIGSISLDWQGRKSYVLEQMKLDHVEDYFQSGVMLFNLAAIRAERKLEEMLDVACAPYIVWGDQDVLNILCKNRVKYLDLRWNTIINHKNITLGQLRKMENPGLLEAYLEARRSPAIIHYAGLQPWKKPDVDMACHFWPVARRTPFYEQITHRMLCRQETAAQDTKKEPDMAWIVLSATRLRKGILRVWGRLQSAYRDGVSLWVWNGADRTELVLQDGLADPCTNILLSRCSNVKNFQASIPLRAAESEICFELMEHERSAGILPISCGAFSRLNEKWPEAYYARDGYVVQLARERRDRLVVYQASEEEISALESAYAGRLDEETRLLRQKAIMGREKARKPVWLVSDRLMSASDNGFALFEYLCRHASEQADIYFVLSRKSKDYDKATAVGKVISPDSKQFLPLYLQAQCVIFAYADAPVVYPARGRACLKDLLPEYFIYLQHGVIKDDFSHDQNKGKCGIDRFVTSSAAERASLLTGPYGYTEAEVILTGLARFDRLTAIRPSEERKLLRFAPTWRAGMYGNHWNNDLQMCDYNRSFRKSGYYKFWNDLINDSRILEVMREKGYQGILQLHPVIRSQYPDFVENSLFRCVREDEGYAEAVRQTALLVTDYSSTAFDYAYCGVPVIYAQFDEASFYRMQNYEKGYFDYWRDGFGPVCHDYESTVCAILSAIENGCAMGNEYRTRAERFFAYRDGGHCARIYHEILKLDEVD